MKTATIPLHSELQESFTQAFQQLANAGVPVSMATFPTQYYADSLAATSPVAGLTILAKYGSVPAVLNRLCQTTEEQSQACLSGALITLMGRHPAACLKAMHDPGVRELFSLCSMFDWEAHIKNLVQLHKTETNKTNQNV